MKARCPRHRLAWERARLLAPLLAPLCDLAGGTVLKRGAYREWFPRYNAYLRSWRWRWRRGLVRLRDGWCRGCGRRGTDAHHLTYERAGRERLDDLVWLCKSCHGKEHKR